MYSETNAVWTADGRYIVFTSAEGRQHRHRLAGRPADDDGAVGDVAARPGPRSDESRHRQRGAGPRRRSGGAPGGRPRRRRRGRCVEVRIDWSGLARRARRLTVPGTTIGGLTPSPEGHSVALTVVDRRRRRRTRRAAPRRSERRHVHHQRRERPAHARAAGAAADGAAAAAAAADAAARAAASAAARTWCSRATAARCTSAPAPASTPRRSTAERAAAARPRAAADAAARRRRAAPRPPAAGADRRRHGAAGHLHRQHRGRSQGAPRAGVQRGLADHEEPLLRRQDARRRLERRARRPTSRCSTTSSTAKNCRPS